LAGAPVIARSDKPKRGPIWAGFTRAQNGHAIDNLARAFHLPRPKVKAGILEMLVSLTLLFDEQTLSRGALARLIDILGKNDYEQVLEDPTLMGATSTQMIGGEALTALAGHSGSVRIAAKAAAAAEISQMIAEYLLPVAAAMFLGALSVRTRPGLTALARHEDFVAVPASDEPAHPTAAQLPVGRGSSGVFGGTTVITSDSGPEREALYRQLAEAIRAEGGAASDPINQARQIIADGLGVRVRNAPWLARAQKLAVSGMQAAKTQINERLRKLRSR
jgi:hypothetical protein